MPRLADVDLVTGEVRCRGPVTRVRYERGRSGELLHVEVKKVAAAAEGFYREEKPKRKGLFGALSGK